jgi:hypothetical protein
LWLRFFWLCPLSAVHAQPNGCAVATHSLGDWTESAEGDPNSFLGHESAPRERRVADFGKESVRPKGGGVLSAALNADRKAHRKGAALFNGLTSWRE